jgi:hypothetical protein
MPARLQPHGDVVSEVVYEMIKALSIVDPLQPSSIKRTRSSFRSTLSIQETHTSHVAELSTSSWHYGNCYGAGKCNVFISHKVTLKHLRQWYFFGFSLAFSNTASGMIGNGCELPSKLVLFQPGLAQKPSFGLA